jgi:hypothetical protein
MPVVKVKYVEDNESFGRFMLSEQVAHPVEQASHEVRLIARGFTPFDPKDEDGMHMRDMFVVQRDPVPWVSKKRPAGRVSYLVINTHRAAAAIEFGFTRAKKAINRSGKGQRMLGRAGARVGEMRGKAGT